MMLSAAIAFERSAPRVLLAAGLTAALGSACAAKSIATGKGGNPVGRAVTAATVQERAQQYWARRQAKDLAGAYTFYCAGYRSRVSQAQYLQLTRLTRFDLVSIDVISAEPAGDGFDVTISYRFVAPTVADQPLIGRTSERWRRDT